MKKTTNKKMVIPFVPVFTVDITDCYTIDETVEALACAKMNGLLTRAEIDALIDIILDVNNSIMMDNATKFSIANGEEYIISARGVERKKPNIFKRFWNWITRK